MSANTILAELPSLSRQELEAIDTKVHELLGKVNQEPRHWGEALAEIAGTVRGLPEDYALNHDHYLHGVANGEGRFLLIPRTF